MIQTKQANGDLSDLIKRMDSKEASAGTSTTSAKPSAAAIYDSDSADIEEAMADYNRAQGDEEQGFGFANYHTDFSTRPPITEETIPNWDALKGTSNVKDKSCIICLKSKMTLDRLSAHLNAVHIIVFDCDLNMEVDDYLEADWNWQYKLKNFPLTRSHAIMTVKKVN